MATFRLGKEFAGLQPKLEKLFAKNGVGGNGYTVAIGMSSDPEFSTPSTAIYNPTAVCDSALLGDQLFESDADKAEYDKNPSVYGFKPVYNFATNKFDTRFTRIPTQDSLLDGQAIAPWNASYFPKLFVQPLISTHGLDMVDRYTGDNPFAEVMNLVLAGYAGNAIAEQAGTMQSNLNHNVAVKSGMMTQAVINVKVFYNYTLEEEQRYARGNNPYGSQLRDLKKQYAEKMLKLTLDVLAYYGNASTDTTGLFNVNTAEEWADQTMTEISADATNTTKGSTAYQLLSKAIIKFAEANVNMPDRIKVGMSLTAYNLLSSMPYSDAYNGQSALSVLKENFGAGRNEFGQKLAIDFYCDPLLNAQTDYNSTKLDNLIITAPSVSGQSTVMAGMPLERFMYPVYPTQYETQYCIMSRWAGIFAPMASAVKVYKGFGINA